jgi:hypothetical protein
VTEIDATRRSPRRSTASSRSGSGLTEGSPADAGADEKPAETKQKKVFVIAPIGREGSETRKRSDQILRHIIDPVVIELGYGRALRADRISESGRITRQIIQHIVEDELVIADLTESNPNVYYELALRHAIKKPFVQILAGEDALPFDVADQRTIMLTHTDLDSVAAAKDELRRQIEALSNEGADVDTPLSFALDVASLRGSDDPGDRTQGEILDMLQELRAMSQHTMLNVARRPTPSADLAALRAYVETTSSNGDVTDEDVNNLINKATSRPHDAWVEAVMRNTNPFMPSRRGAATPAATDPWATPASDEPPF